MKNIFFSILLASFFINVAQGQTLKAFLKAAEKATEEKDFYNAMHYYNIATEFDTTNLDLKYNYAYSAKTFNAYGLATEGFQYVVDNDNNNTFPLASYYLAEMQQNLGRYDDAKRNYQLFLSENSDTLEREILRAEKNIENINWALDQQDNPAFGYKVNQLSGSINSPYSDFGAVENEGQLYYSSLRFVQEDENYPNRLYSKILTDSNPLTETKDESEKRTKKNTKENKNTSTLHEAHNAFSKDGNRMYYTICHYKNAMDIACDLYVKEKDKNGNFGSGKKLAINSTEENITSTQPSISTDINGNETLYFVSDRSGGKGGLDIWYSKLENGTYTDPTNLSVVNTNEDEITPFFHNESGTLYFSSNGYMGMGGFDVYKSAEIEGALSTPENMLSPVNTSYNDLYYYLNEEGTQAYMSSNRIGSMYLEESFEACCYDIYEVEIEEVFIRLDALVFDIETEEELPGARLRIYDSNTNELLYDTLNALKHDFNFELKCGRQYTIITDRDGYDSDTTSLSLKDCSTKDPVTKKIFLTPQELKLEVLTYVLPTNDPLNGATVTLLDLTDPDSEPIFIENLNGNDFGFDIIAGREYRIIATKRGFDAVTLTFKALDVKDGKITKELFFKNEYINLNEYLPVAVYFDNDRPNPRSKQLNSSKSYSETYFPYLEKKEEFKREFTKKMNGDTKAIAQSRIDNFFEADVRGGYNKLKLFLDKLAFRLESGDEIELFLKGFASPRAANRYNLALGQRRIWSIKNEIRQHSNGKLRSFIESGKLKVIEVSFGEEIAPTEISDSYSDRRQSVYSVEASKERKAELYRVKVIN